MSESVNALQGIPGDFELDASAGELRKNGATIHLPAQLFRLLTLLTQRSGEVVTREEIRSILWSDRFVNFDDSINSAIKRLRQCLDDSAVNPKLIKTLPGRGYRFAVPTEPIKPIHSVTIDAAESAEPRLAVLSFRNLSGNPADESLTTGLTDALVTAVAKIPGLRVVCRRGTLSAKNADHPSSTVERKLKVDALLQGAVLRSGNRVRVTVQLLNTATEEFLWAESYDYLFRDILAFHSDVSGAIAEHVAEKLIPESLPRIPSNGHSRHPAAYQAYLKGHNVFKNVTDEGLWKARHYWKKAIREDPKYAKAYAGLAESYNMLGISGLLPANEALVHAREAATKALDLDESLSQAHTALGYTRMLEWDWEGAGKEFRRALQIDPNFTAGNPCHYVEYLLATGRPETAVAELERAQEIQPLSLFLSAILGWAYYGAGEYDKAIWQHRRVVSIDPHFGMAHWCLGLDYIQKRRYRAAIDCFQKCRLLGGPHSGITSTGYAYAAMGDRERAQQALKEMKRAAKSTYTPAYGFAAIHAGLGEADAAFESLTLALKEHEVGVIYLKWDPHFDVLRADPRFDNLLKTIGLISSAYSSSAAD